MKLIRECVVDTATHRRLCHPWATFLDWLLGPRCNITGERTFRRDRAAHELEHYGEGKCS